jgi:hypothetical protein
MNNKNDILTRLYNANANSEKFTILEEVMCDAGFDAVLYSFYPKLSQLAKSLQPVFQFSKGYEPLIENYQKENFSGDDFVIRLLTEGAVEPFDWWFQAKKTKMSDQEKKVNHIARHQFGIMKGICLPTLTNDLGIAGVSLISFKAEDEHRQLDAKDLDQLHNCARMYHNHIMINQNEQSQFILPILDLLTPKKKLVIKHLISGKPMKTIEGVTERYAEKLLLELRKGFGNISKNELIYFFGLINISEYL